MKIGSDAWLLAALVFAAFASNGATITEGPSVEFTNGTQAVVHWSTDISTGSRVVFGEAIGALTRRAQGQQGIDHSVTLPELEPGTRWFYSVGTARVSLATNEFVVPGRSTAPRAPPVASGAKSQGRNAVPSPKAPPSRETWGDIRSLPDHFARHGADFHAQTADDYARMAWEFRQRAHEAGFLIKVDSGGVERIFDPKSGAFGAYNRNGTTKTFFKPRSRDYFERQPGEPIHSKGRD